MTVMCMLAGLAPILWSTGAGSDVMKRIAAPMMGGIVTSFLLELAVYPALYSIRKRTTARSVALSPHARCHRASFKERISRAIPELSSSAHEGSGVLVVEELTVAE